MIIASMNLEIAWFARNTRDVELLTYKLLTFLQKVEKTMYTKSFTSIFDELRHYVEELKFFIKYKQFVSTENLLLRYSPEEVEEWTYIQSHISKKEIDQIHTIAQTIFTTLQDKSVELITKRIQAYQSIKYCFFQRNLSESSGKIVFHLKNERLFKIYSFYISKSGKSFILKQQDLVSYETFEDFFFNVEPYLEKQKNSSTMDSYEEFLQAGDTILFVENIKSEINFDFIKESAISFLKKEFFNETHPYDP